MEGVTNRRFMFEGKPEEPVVSRKVELPAHSEPVILDGPVTRVKLLRNRSACPVLSDQIQYAELERGQAPEHRLRPLKCRDERNSFGHWGAHGVARCA